MSSSALFFNNSILGNDKITKITGSSLNYDTEQIRKDSKNM